MGRKIPAKKHRGVKDPLEQQAKRLRSLQGKINAPPKDPDEQPVPRSLARLFAFTNKLNLENKPILRKRNKPLNKKGADSIQTGVGDNPISRLRKLPGESGRGFSLRINSAIRTLHGDFTQDDYLQDIEEEDARGSRMEALREKRARKLRRAAPAGRAPAAPAETHLTRTQKLALKKKAKKEKANEAAAAARQEVRYERVAFGDVTHAPPTLAPPRAPPRAPQRPGRRDLLLCRMLRGEGGGAGEGAGRAAEALRRERARLDAVQAYRALKAAKLNKAGVSGRQA